MGLTGPAHLTVAAPTTAPATRYAPVRPVAPVGAPSDPTATRRPAPSPASAAASPLDAGPLDALPTLDAPTPTATPAAPTAPKASPAPTAAANPAATSAAERYGWGTPVRVEDFTSNVLLGVRLYDGPGHAGAGRWTPDAVTVGDGILTINGDPRGDTGGMAWVYGTRYGRWEVRMRAPATDPSYNPLLLLWPDADDSPTGGEIDFMELKDPTGQRPDFYLHHGAENALVHTAAAADATQWHDWAVEWNGHGLTGFVDGVPWFHTDDTTVLPPGPLHLCVQLGWFPHGSSARAAQMQVDWVRQYAP